MAEDTRPNCKCHGEPMAKNGRRSNRGKQHYVCSVKRSAYQRDKYDNLTGVAYSWRRLQDRRWRALYRRAEREASRG